MVARGAQAVTPKCEIYQMRTVHVISYHFGELTMEIPTFNRYIDRCLIQLIHSDAEYDE